MQHLKERRTPTSRVDLGIVESSWPSQMLTNTPSEHLRTRRQKASVCRRGGYTFDYLGCARPPLFRAQSLALTISQRSPRQISSPVDLEIWSAYFSSGSFDDGGFVRIAQLRSISFFIVFVCVANPRICCAVRVGLR